MNLTHLIKTLFSFLSEKKRVILYDWSSDKSDWSASNWTQIVRQYQKSLARGRSINAY